MNTSGYSWSKPAAQPTLRQAMVSNGTPGIGGVAGPSSSPAKLAATIAAAASTPYQGMKSYSNTGSTIGGTSSGSSTPVYSAPPPVFTPPPPPAAAYANAAPVLAPPTPVTANAAASAQNVAGDTFTRLGGGTAGAFERERQARGPRSTTSITPEMLMRIARQRFSQQR